MTRIYYETEALTVSQECLLAEVKRLLPPAEMVRALREHRTESGDVQALLSFLDVAVVGLLTVIASAGAGLADGMQEAAATDAGLQLCEVLSAMRSMGDNDEATFLKLRDEYVRVTGLETS